MAIKLNDKTKNITLVHEPLKKGENILTINANDGYILSEDGSWYTGDYESSDNLDEGTIIANNEKSMTTKVNISRGAEFLTIRMNAIENDNSEVPPKINVTEDTYIIDICPDSFEKEHEWFNSRMLEIAQGKIVEGISTNGVPKKPEITGVEELTVHDFSLVTKIVLYSNNLTGEIPKSIGNLSNLTTLNLSNNNLTGEIPKSIDNLNNLTYLSLRMNNLTGEIPKSVDFADDGLSHNILNAEGNLSSATRYNFNSQYHKKITIPGTQPILNSQYKLSELVNIQLEQSAKIEEIAGLPVTVEVNGVKYFNRKLRYEDPLITGIQTDQEQKFRIWVYDGDVVKNDTYIEYSTVTDKEPEVPEKQEISMKVYNRMENCTLVNDKYYVGENEIIIIANDGYIISNNGSIEISDYEGNDREVDIVANGEKEVRTKIKLAKNDRELRYNLTAKKEDIKTNNFSNIYQTNDVELNQLSTSRWVTGTGETTDTGRFITSLYKIPFSIDEKLLVDSTIKLATFNTDIPTRQVIKNDFTFTLFDKVIDRTFNNELDYEGLEVNFIIPFCDVINIKPNKVINKRIVVKMSIDLYTSYSTFYIYSDDEVIYTESKKIGSDIPYINKYNLNVVGDNENIINEVKNVKVLLIRQKLIEEETYECDYEEYLNQLKGFYVFNVDNINISKNYNENDEIMRLLNDGIYIK